MKSKQFAKNMAKRFSSGKREINVISLGDPDVGSSVSQRITTSSQALNTITGGGIPCGRITEIFGLESNGKSSLAADIIANTQKLGGMVLLIDSEGCFEPKWAEALGVQIDDVVYSDESETEACIDLIEQAADEMGAISEPCLILWDTVAASIPAEKLEGDVDGTGIDPLPKLLSRGLKRINSKLPNNAALVILNQVRTKFNVKFGDPNDTVGGAALRFYASLRIKLSRVSQLSENGQSLGITCKAYTVKNKTSPPFKMVEYDLYFNQGIDDSGFLLDVLVNQKVMTGSGGWYQYKGSEKFRRKDAKEFLSNLPKEERDELYSYLIKPPKVRAL